MIYKPSVGGMWDPTVLYFKGYYYMMSMHFEKTNDWNGMWLAKSPDGVHWEDVGRVLTEDMYVCKMFAHIVGDKVVINHGSLSRRPNTDNDMLRFFESEDLINWTHLYDQNPDPAYYHPVERWDHMYVIQEDDGYYGYVVGVPHEQFQSAWGMMKSSDGIHFDILPPPQIEWGEVPQWKMFEGGGCEKIGEKYYYIGGTTAYCRSWGYGLYTFVSDMPTGPFHPDEKAFRLCGFSTLPGRVFIQNLAAFCKGEDGEILISNAIDGGGAERIFLLPIRKAVVDNDGHLRLGYWKNNEKAKGKQYAIDLHNFELHYSTKVIKNEMKQELVLANNTMMAHTAYPEGNQIDDYDLLIQFNQELNFDKGIVAEGTFCASLNKMNPDDTWPACWRPSSVGFFFGETETFGTAIVLETGDACKRKSSVQEITLGEILERKTIDVTDEGCATVCGVDIDKPHSFKLFVRQNMYELYVDDLLVQTFVTMRVGVSSFGILLQNVRIQMSDFHIFEMNV